MAGVSSYAPKEIEFVLKSIVQKHKPSHIIEEFVRRFRKTLNQNQIRYIKNKYGKDPTFGSPMVNYKGGNARDLKNFRRQKLQRRRQAEIDGEESPNEREAPKSQELAATTLRMGVEGVRPCFPNPQITFQTSGTSFLGANATSFTYMQPHMLLTQVSGASNAKPLGSDGNFSPFGHCERGEDCDFDKDLGSQEPEGPSALFFSSQGTTDQTVFADADNSNVNHGLGIQSSQLSSEPIFDQNALEMARLLALSAPDNVTASLASPSWPDEPTLVPTASGSPVQRLDMQPPLAPSVLRRRKSAAFQSPAQLARPKQQQQGGSDDFVSPGASPRALSASPRHLRRSRASHGASPKLHESRAQGTIQSPKQTLRVITSPRNTDPWHRLPPGVKGRRSARHRASDPYPQMPDAHTSFEQFAAHHDIARAHRRQTAPEAMNRRAEKLRHRSRAASDCSDSDGASPTAMYNMGPPGSIEIVDSPLPNMPALPSDTSTIDPASIDLRSTVRSDNDAATPVAVPTNQVPLYSGLSATAPSLVDGSVATTNGLLRYHNMNLQDRSRQTLLNGCGQYGTNPIDWSFDLNELCSANNDPSAYDDGTVTLTSHKSYDMMIPLDIKPEDGPGLDATLLSAVAFDGSNNNGEPNHSSADGLYQPNNERYMFTGFGHRLLDTTTVPLFLQPMADQVTDSFDNQFIMPQHAGEAGGRSAASHVGMTNVDWANNAVEPLDPKMFEVLTPESLPGFDLEPAKM